MAEGAGLGGVVFLPRLDSGGPGPSNDRQGGTVSNIPSKIESADIHAGEARLVLIYWALGARLSWRDRERFEGVLWVGRGKRYQDKAKEPKSLEEQHLEQG